MFHKACIVVGLALCLLGCPLPFQYTPRGYSSATAAVDPSTPSVSASPVISYSSLSGGGTISSLDPVLTSGDTTLTLSTDTVGAVIYYTTDGTTPNPLNPTTTVRYTPGSPPVLAMSHPTVDNSSARFTVMAVAIGPNMKPSMVTQANLEVHYPQTAPPVFSLPGGSYTTDQSVALSCATAGAAIYYTKVDGAGPAPRPEPGQPGTTQYTAPISITGPSNTCTISAIAVRSPMIDSVTMSASYSVAYPGAAAPVFNPPPSTYFNDTTVTLSSTAGSTIWYTTDGSSPEVGKCASMAQGSTLTLRGGPDGTVTLRALAEKSGLANSPTSTGIYTFQAAAPVAVPPGGGYDVPQTVTLSTATSSAVIYFTLDGSTPSTGSTRYEGAITVAPTTTLKAVAVRTDYLQSGVSVNAYKFRCAPPTFSSAGGVYYDPFSVTLSCASPGAVIHYTVDGSTPTAASPIFAAPVPVAAIGVTTTITAVAVDPSGILADSAVASVSYDVVLLPPNPSVGAVTFSTISVSVPAIASAGNYYYQLYQGASAGGPWTPVGPRGPSIDYVDSGLSAGQTRYYYVGLIYTDIMVSIGSGVTAGTTLPEIVTITVPGPYAAPTNYYSEFFDSAGSIIFTAPLGLRQGGYTFVPYSHRFDNYSFVMVRVFDAGNNFVKDVELSGTRYVWQVTVNEVTGMVIYTGQAGYTASISWSSLAVH